MSRRDATVASRPNQMQLTSSWRCTCLPFSSLAPMSVLCNVVKHPRSYPLAMGLPAVSSTFRFSSSQHGLALISRRLTPSTYPSWRPSKRMFLRSALLQNKFSNPEASGHPESAAQTRPDVNGSHSSCLCCGQRKLINMDYDQGASRSSLMDATLTALMGMGIGEPQPWTVRLCRVQSFPHYTVGSLVSGFCA